MSKANPRGRGHLNLDGTTPDKGLGAILKWQIGDRLAGRRTKAGPPYATPRRDNDGRALYEAAPHLTWIGHATFVQRLGNQLVATDPVWSPRLHTVRRLAPPGVALEACPKIDVVTISHAHYDHLDLPTLERIGKDALYIVPKDNGELLRRIGLSNIVELGWWEAREVGELRVTLVPAQHWSMRVPWDRNKRLWGGFIFESSEGTSYHAGDTGFSERLFSEIAERFPKIDWAMLPIGAYDPAWFMQPQHMSPEEAGRAWEILGAKDFIAMHWGTFKLTDEPIGEPPERIRTFWKDRGHDPARLWVMDLGETRPLSI
ncbi:MAG: MBL fold metallo-hydrolase [Polyangiaceae bacterium]|nr:MBL fold metallo-hydrolase [Polyangiaceae bacterium]